MKLTLATAATAVAAAAAVAVRVGPAASVVSLGAHPLMHVCAKTHAISCNVIQHVYVCICYIICIEQVYMCADALHVPCGCTCECEGGRHSVPQQERERERERESKSCQSRLPVFLNQICSQNCRICEMRASFAGAADRNSKPIRQLKLPCRPPRVDPRYPLRCSLPTSLLIFRWAASAATVLAHHGVLGETESGLPKKARSVSKRLKPRNLHPIADISTRGLIPK